MSESRPIASCSSKQTGILSFFQSNNTSVSVKRKDPPESKTERYKRYDQSVRVRKFNTDWHKQYPWIHYDEETEIMYCSTCREFPTLADTTGVLYIGAGQSKTGFRKETLDKHDSSTTHKKCVDAKKVKDNPRAGAMTKLCRKLDIANIHRLNALFNTAYYVAKENLAFRKFESLCQLQSKNNVELGQNYQNTHGVKEFISNIAQVQNLALTARIQKSNYVAVLADGSTDSSVLEQEAVFVRYVSSGKPVTEFVSVERAKSSDARGVLDCMNSALAKVGLDSDMLQRKLVALNLDGAAVNMGRNNGVQALVRNELPHVIPIHCINHNLELAILDVRKVDPYLTRFDSMLKDIFKLYYYSPKRKRELETVADLLNEKLLHFGGLQQIRWVSSQERALTSLATNLAVTSVHLEEIGSGKGNDAARARGLLRDLRSAKFIKTLFFMTDFIHEIAALSKLFQTKELLLIDVLPKLEVVMLGLMKMKSSPGLNFQKFLECMEPDNMYKGIKLIGEVGTGLDPLHLSMLDCAVEFLDERFKVLQKPPYSLFEVLNFKNWPKLKEDVISFGDSEFKSLVEHFESVLPNPEMTLSEWLPLKLTIWKVKSSKPLDVFHDLLTDTESYNDIMNACAIIEIMMSMSISTAEVERCFSAMNISKNSLRTNLEQSSLNDILNIKINGPSVSDFNPDSSVEMWLDTTGTRHVKGHSTAQEANKIESQCLIIDMCQ